MTRRGFGDVSVSWSLQHWDSQQKRRPLWADRGARPEGACLASDPKEKWRTQLVPRAQPKRAYCLSLSRFQGTQLESGIETIEKTLPLHFVLLATAVVGDCGRWRLRSLSQGVPSAISPPALPSESVQLGIYRRPATGRGDWTRGPLNAMGHAAQATQ